MPPAGLSRPTPRGKLQPLGAAPLEPAETYELKVGFGELALIYKSLQVVRTLGALPPQDELLDDTLELVDQALKKAV